MAVGLPSVKIGQFSYRRPWVAIIAWLLLLAAVIVPVAVNGVSMSSNMSINGTKSQFNGPQPGPGRRKERREDHYRHHRDPDHGTG